MLSYAEAHKYLGVSVNDETIRESQVTPTAYAKQAGAWTDSQSEAGWWWIRSPGFLPNFAARVFSNGSLRYLNVSYPSGCIRPALWIDLESDIF